MQIRALAADAVGGAFGVSRDAGGCPRRDGLAQLFRQLLEARGATLEADLIHAATELAAPDLVGSSDLQTRARSVLEVLVRAGEIVRASGGAGAMCWGRPVQIVNLGSGQAAAIGTAPLTSDASPQGGGIVRGVAAQAGAPGLAVCLGAPSFRQTLTVLGLSAGRGTLSEFRSVILDAGRTSEVAVPARLEILQTGLPDGASLGKADGRHVLVVPKEDGAVAFALPDRDAACWLSLACRLDAGLTTLAEGPLGLPGQIRTAVALGGEPLDDDLTTWSLPAFFQQSVRSWLGEAAAPEAAEAPDTDADQYAVIGAEPGARLIVEAGPGSGKTYVAIERVRALIDADVPPTRIWMISFTHAATGELRSRIASSLGDPRAASELRVSTLDSLAFRLRRYGSSESNANGGYSEAISEAGRLVESGDPQLSGFLRQLEHVIVDEVQDLTADRSALVAAIVRRLSPQCGVTLFQDSAQAIYGFAEVGDAPPRPLSAVLLGEPALGFSVLNLHHDHRTRAPQLHELKARMRAALLDEALTPEEKYAAVRADIERSTPATGGAVEDRLPSISSMILFRSRVALISAAVRYWGRGRSFRLRLPRSEPVLAPWIGAVLSRFRADELARTDFQHLWEETWPAPLHLTAERAWQVLQSFQGAGTGSHIDLAGITRELASGRAPPAPATQPVFGRTGALLSTVHAVKGLEAEHVVLMLPRAPEKASGEALAEEARVLFVGATRPRATLEVAGGEELFAGRIRGGRRWVRRPDGHARVEIGLEGDTEPFPTTQPMGPDADARVARLWAAAERPLPLTGVRTEDGYELLGAGASGRGESFGALSSGFVDDLRAIGRELHADGAWPGRTIRGLHLAGVRTVSSFDAQAQEGRARFSLAPVVIGLPVVYFNPFKDRDAAGPGTL